jgi:hypothetical protein
MTLVRIEPRTSRNGLSGRGWVFRKVHQSKRTADVQFPGSLFFVHNCISCPFGAQPRLLSMDLISRQPLHVVDDEELAEPLGRRDLQPEFP